MVNPEAWSILICFRNVDFPLSPVPRSRIRTLKSNIILQIRAKLFQQFLRKKNWINNTKKFQSITIRHFQFWNVALKMGLKGKPWYTDSKTGFLFLSVKNFAKYRSLILWIFKSLNIVKTYLSSMSNFLLFNLLINFLINFAFFSRFFVFETGHAGQCPFWHAVF